MKRQLLRIVPALALVAGGVLWLMPHTQGQSTPIPSTARGDWTHYTADVRGTKFMPLDQINAGNFNRLQLAWRFSTASLGPVPEFGLAATPLEINNVVYAVGGGGGRRAVVALNATNGEMLWMHKIDEGHRAEVAPRRLSGRGVSYWTDGRGDERIFYVTIGYQLVALNAKTGQMIQSFGNNGIIDLKVGVMIGKVGSREQRQIDLVGGEGEIGLHATPTVTGDMVIVGSSMLEGLNYRARTNAKGLVRAFDARTGKQIWRFDTMPGPGQFGHETWENDSWYYTGNTGVWTHITVDEEAGLVYLPVESPTIDLYGGHRPGNNLFAESLVAVDLKTGVRKWHFQIVHHPIWDHDLSSPAMLVDINVDGKPIKAVAMPTKQSFLYMFDRVTGQPVWPMPETPVPQSNVPGEKTSPTQPIPSRPPAYSRAFLKPDDLIDFTPALRAQALSNLKNYRWEQSPYVPAVVPAPGGPQGAINVGNASGGVNWPGGSLDPETQVAFIQASNSAVSGTAVQPVPPERGDATYTSGGGRSGGPETGPFGLEELNARGAGAPGAGAARGRGRGAAAAEPAPAGGRGAAPAAGGRGAAPAGGAATLTTGLDGLPIVKPPYGVLTAIDLNRGTIKWQVPHGETPDNIRNHPLLRGMDIPRTGQGGSQGLLVTRSLVVIGDNQVTSPPGRPRGAMLRAYDKETGKNVGEVLMPAGQSGSPMTYMSNGKQYIIIAVAEGNHAGEYLAFTLPDSEVRSTGQNGQN